MPRLKLMSGREVCKILSRHGYSQVRQKGSHIQMRKEIETDLGMASITVTVPDHREIGLKTLSRIILRSQLPRSLFES